LSEPKQKYEVQTVPEKSLAEIVSTLVLQGDLSKMDATQKVQYYNNFCTSLGLNPLTQPFQILKLQGKEVLYARKDATEQLRAIHGVSITEMTSTVQADVYIVRVKGQDKTGRTDFGTGAVSINGLKGEGLCNAMMKAETKAKRRFTLSICGLGMTDETEIETIPNAVTVNMDIATGEIIEDAKIEAPEPPKPEPVNTDQLDTYNAILEQMFIRGSGAGDGLILQGKKHKGKELKELSPKELSEHISDVETNLEKLTNGKKEAFEAYLQILKQYQLPF
jgi:hypothetical protein